MVAISRHGGYVREIEGRIGKERGYFMNELVTTQKTETEIAISSETKELIQSSIADSTLKRYQRLSREIEAWLGGQMLNDALLAKIR